MIKKQKKKLMILWRIWKKNTSVVEYLDAMDNSITLVEYSPWEDSGFYREKYARNVYTYDLKDISYDNLKDLLSDSFKNQIPFECEVETSLKKPEEFYGGTKYVLEEIIQDETITKEVPDEEHCAFLIVLLSSLLMEIIIAFFFIRAKINWKQKWENNVEEFKEYEEAIQIYQNLPYVVREKNYICLKKRNNEKRMLEYITIELSDLL